MQPNRCSGAILSHRAPWPFPAVALCLLGVCFSGGGVSVHAQAPAPAATVVPPAQVSNRALEHARALLAESQARENAIRSELLDLDRQMDARIDETVALLKGIKDSTESKTEVANVKKQAVEALEALVRAYLQERGRRLGEMQGPGATQGQRADLGKEVGRVDAEIDARVDQIVDLAASMTTREALQRYDTYYADYGVAKIEREEYRASRRQDSQADQTQARLARELEDAIAAIEREIALVPQRCPRDRQAAELERLTQVRDSRREDLRRLSNAYPAEGRSIGDEEANEIGRELKYAREDVRDLWGRLQAQANSLTLERQRRRQLEARVRYLEQEPGAPSANAGPTSPPPP